METAENLQQITLLFLRHVEFVERTHQVFDQGLKLTLCDFHVLVGGLHVLAGVLARSARSRANLFDQVQGQTRSIGLGEFLVYARIRQDASGKLIYYRLDGVNATET